MKKLKKLINRFFLLVVVVIVIAGCVLAGSGYKMYRDALNHQSLESKVAEIQSNPSYTTLSEMPELYLDAVVAVEDHRFEQHFGIDLIAIGRAAWNNLTSWSLQEGGNTITQQLAKNMYFTQEKSFIRKIAEMFMAFWLESSYTKDEILELYVNSIYFGDGYYCVRDASQGYFGKDPIDMTGYESTLLAGIPNAPSVYSLTANLDLAEQRQRCYIFLRDLVQIDKLVLQQCDVEMYLETMKYGVSYGKKLKFRGFQKSLFMLLQQRLSTALISNAKLEECRQFLTEEWIGKKNSSLYKLTIMNLNLVEAYYHLDTDKFNSLFQKAAPAFKKHKLFVAEQMFLEQKYEQTAAFLGTYKGKNPYNEVQRQYLLGECFDKTGNKQMAEECMRYVSTHGNTMPCKKKAQEWILSNMPKRIESSIPN